MLIEHTFYNGIIRCGPCLHDIQSTGEKRNPGILQARGGGDLGRGGSYGRRGGKWGSSQKITGFDDRQPEAKEEYSLCAYILNVLFRPKIF